MNRIEQIKKRQRAAKHSTRSRRWQMRQKASGHCILCRNPRSERSADYCEEHRLKTNERQRRLQKAKRMKEDPRRWIVCSVCGQKARHNARTCPERKSP